MGSASVDSINLKMFGGKCYIVADVYYGVRPRIADSILVMYRFFSLNQRPPTFLAPGTGFLQDFCIDGEG